MITLFGTHEPDYSLPNNKLPLELDFRTAFEIYKARLAESRDYLFISTGMACICVVGVLIKGVLWAIVSAIFSGAVFLILLRWLRI